jgi:hypothetical protein
LVTCDRSVDFSGYSIFRHKSSNWNIFESGVKHLTSNGQMMVSTIKTVPRALYLVWSMVFSTILSNISVTVTISFNGGNRCTQRKLPTHYIHKLLIHHLSIGG